MSADPVCEALTDAAISPREVGLGGEIHPSRRAVRDGRPPASPTVSGSLCDLVEAYLAASLAQGCARGTVAYRRVYLEQLLRWLEPRRLREARRVTPRVLADYVVHLHGRRVARGGGPRPLSPRTLAAHVSVLRSFFAWLTRRRVLLFDPAADLALRHRPPVLPKAVLAPAEVEALLTAPGGGPLGLRDRAILETLYSTGIRRAELCGLDLYDLDAGGGTLRVRCGKGGKGRIVPVGACALEALQDYLRAGRPYLVRRAKEPALFVADLTHHRIGVKTLNFLVSKHAAAAGMEKRVTPHVLRHTCATHLLAGGADIRHVQAILGHASVATTQLYTRVAVADLAAVHRRCHPRAKLAIA